MIKREQPDLPSAEEVDRRVPVPEEIHIEVDADPADAAAPFAGEYLTPTPAAGINVQTERSSGGISIGGGDFATPAPAPRKRRTTQPRGLPTVGDASPPVEDGAAEVPVAAAQPVVTADDRMSSADEFSATEATPPPIELTSDPAPEAPSGLADFSSRPTPMPTPSPALVAPPPPVTLAAARTPTPIPSTPPPPLNLPPSAAVSPSQGAPSDDGAGAIPSRPMPDVDSGSNITPLASTLAHMAEAGRHGHGIGTGDGDESADDDVELMDAPVVQPVVPPPARKTPPPPPPLTATPPPIPKERSKLSPELLSALPVPEALSQRPRRAKRSKPWFEEVFDEDYMRTLPYVSAGQSAREATFIEASLEAPAGAELLDIGCGYGRHAIELAHRGYKVTGLDLSLPLLIRAADDAQRRAVSPNFVHADMREIAFERQFDAAYCMLTTFGYFDEDANLRVAEGIAKALKPGGRFLLDVVNRDYIVGDLPTRIWWEGSGCVVLEEVDFNFHTSRLMSRRSVVFDDGRQLEQEISIRAYGLHELGRLLRQAGFRVLDISGSFATRSQFFGSASRNLLILAEKRVEDR